MHRGRRWAWAAVAAVVLTAGAAACSSGDRDSSAERATTTTAPPGGATATTDGATIFHDNCAECHGADATGGQGPSLADLGDTMSRADALAVVTKGRRAMPSWSGTLSSAQIAAVVDWLRSGGPTSGASTSTTSATTTKRGSLTGTPPELAEAGNWAAANGDLLGHRVAKGSHITTKTIGSLRRAWTFEAPGGGTFGNFTTTPLVVGDRVYVGDLTTRIHALSLATGTQQFVVGADASIFGPTGVGVGWGRLYGTTANAKGRGTVVVAYEAATGKQLWSTDIGRDGGDINIQPVAYDGLVFAATSGYGAGTKATIYALDAQTGAIAWRFRVVEDPNLWGHPELNSGGGVWYPPSIDAKRGLVYFGTGNPYPFPGAKGYPNGSSRPGDNRWTDSIVALDLHTGKLRWGYQSSPHDLFDQDAMITGRVDVTVRGRRRSLAISTGKLGVVTALDADTGEVLWRTPVGTHRNDELTKLTGPTLVYPGSLGGVQTPIAIAGDTIYTCVENAPTQYAGPEETSYGFSVKLGTDDAELVAIDAATGTIRWKATVPGDSFGGATVVNDLVLTSSFSGVLRAFDRSTGRQVWSWKGPGGINGWPAVAGDQIIVPFGMAEPPQLVALRLPTR